MDRRTFLKTTTAAAAASTATAGAANAAVSDDNVPVAPALVAQHLELQFAAAPGVADAARALVRDIAIATDGRIAINLIEASVHADAIQSGGLDGAVGLLPELCDAPELALFSGLPGRLAVSPEQLLAWHDTGGGGLYLDHAAEQYNLTAFIVGHSGAATGLWASADMIDARAFATARLETTGFGNAIAEHIRDAYSAAPDGDAEGIRLAEIARTPMEAYLDLPADSRQIWYREGLHDQGFATTLVLARDVWDRMGHGDQLVIATLARAAAYTDLARTRVSDRLVAPAVLASLPVRTEPLEREIALSIQHAAIDVVHQSMARTRILQPAFQAYGAYYQAMIGAPLPGSRAAPMAGV